MAKVQWSTALGLGMETHVQQRQWQIKSDAMQIQAETKLQDGRNEFSQLPLNAALI